MSKLLAAIRQAIQSSGKRDSEIAKGSGVLQSQICRLLKGQRGLSIDAAEKLAEYLGLEITITAKRRKAKR